MKLVYFRRLFLQWLQTRFLGGRRNSAVKAVVRGNWQCLPREQVSQYRNEKGSIAFKQLRQVATAQRLRRTGVVIVFAINREKVSSFTTNYNPVTRFGCIG